MKTNSPSANRRPSPRTRQPAALRQGYGRQAAVRHKSAKAGPRRAAVVPDKPVVLFDFDGTLSAGDANTGFWKYCFRHSLRPWIFLPVVLVGVIMRGIAAIIPRRDNRVRRIDIVWRQWFRAYISPALVRKLAPGFIAEHKKNRWGWALAQVAKERANGNITILTSAGPDYLILPLVRDMDFDYIIASEMDPWHPWRYRFFNYMADKIDALSPLLNGGVVVRAYSDNATDRPMMSLAREQVWIDPKTGARVSPR
ncbi:MAG: haloacid dehalogenase-like hydrolase [Proteobacteria bacterium]|nr:haloacid dehalogenase-like hydrolase [Pseudomonadota bacterium]